MNRLIQRLVDGIAGIKDEEIVSPKYEVEDGEVVLGELNDPELRRFHIFLGKVSLDFKERAKTVKGSKEVEEGAGLAHNSNKCPRCLANSELLPEKNYQGAISSLFWAAIQDSLSSGDKIKVLNSRGIGLRKGWKIVLLPENGTLSELLGIISILGA